jgi:sugar O-acyltransferase (sialic acid O-acetyltransferase NeuD family)
MNKTKVIIVGCRQDGHGKVVLEASREIPGVIILGFLDDKPSPADISDFPRLGPSNAWSKYLHEGDVFFHVAIGDNPTRRKIGAAILNAGGRLKSLVHPRAVVYPTVQIGDGCFIGASALLGPSVTVGISSIVNHGAIVEHDSALGNYVNVSSGFVCGGRVRLEDGVFAGVGVNVIPDVTISRWTYLGAGAVVTRNTKPHFVYVGVPARPIRSLGTDSIPLTL